MATMLAVCGGLGRKKLTHLVTTAVSLTHPGIHTVLWRRGCSQYKQVSSNEDLVRIFFSCFRKVSARHFFFPGLCGKKQKEITKAIKRAQILGFMPVTYKDPAYLKDPKVCNIRYRE
uniref:Mitochondrial ribosomal protein S18C n=1 Tax=Aotus nancymaae TaxID=37293 RepID=A0A2K5DHU4_AOTNA